MRRIGALRENIAAMERIAALVANEFGRELREQERLLRTGLEAGLPVPVLSVSGVNSLETPWTQYLAHVLDPRASRAIGSVLGPAVFKHLARTEVSADDLVVLSEVYLGRALCVHCEHGCNIDLILLGPTHVLAVEQKVTSGPSDWRCTRPDVTHRQLDEYAAVLAEWAGHEHRRRYPSAGGAPVVERFYLTLGGTSHVGTTPWTPVSHKELSQVVAAAARRLPAGSPRSSVSSLLFDWNAPPFGDWPAAVNRLQEILIRSSGAPDAHDAMQYAGFIENHADLRDALLALAQV